jgi:hypothetical protein
MATGKLGSASLVANTLTSIYACPSTALFATINVLVANGGNNDAAIRIAVSTATTAGLVMPADYITPGNLILAPTDPPWEQKGVVVASGEVVWVSSSVAGATVRVHGFEQAVAIANPLTTVQGNGAMKASIVLFDTVPGAGKTFTVPAGASRIRAFVVGGGGGSNYASHGGGGGGYSEIIQTVTGGQTFTYTVGVGGSAGGNGGTSSFGTSLISATPGISGGVGGTGTGGSVNTSGGSSTGVQTGGGASGHRFGNGGGSSNDCGGGWSQPGDLAAGGCGGVDGWGLGLIPGLGGQTGMNGGYGAGGGGGSSAGVLLGGQGGLGGGGGATYSNTTPGSGGVGGGAGGTASGTGPTVALGGTGVVGVEVIG